MDYTCWPCWRYSAECIGKRLPASGCDGLATACGVCTRSKNQVAVRDEIDCQRERHRWTGCRLVLGQAQAQTGTRGVPGVKLQGPGDTPGTPITARRARRAPGRAGGAIGRAGDERNEQRRRSFLGLLGLMRPPAPCRFGPRGQRGPREIDCASNNVNPCRLKKHPVAQSRLHRLSTACLPSGLSSACIHRAPTTNPRALLLSLLHRCLLKSTG